jgi:hypothetical protein
LNHAAHIEQSAAQFNQAAGQLAQIVIQTFNRPEHRMKDLGQRIGEVSRQVDLHGGGSRIPFRDQRPVQRRFDDPPRSRGFSDGSPLRGESLFPIVGRIALQFIRLTNRFGVATRCPWKRLALADREVAAAGAQTKSVTTEGEKEPRIAVLFHSQDLVACGGIPKFDHPDFVTVKTVSAGNCGQPPIIRGERHLATVTATLPTSEDLARSRVPKKDEATGVAGGDDSAVVAYCQRPWTMRLAGKHPNACE